MGAIPVICQQVCTYLLQLQLGLVGWNITVDGNTNGDLAVVIGIFKGRIVALHQSLLRCVVIQHHSCDFPQKEWQL